MSRTWKLVLVSLGAVGALALAAAAVTAGGLRLNQASPASNHVVAAASPTPKQGNASKPAKVLRQSVTQAESQVLGIQPKDLTANLRRGKTVHQMADEKGISRDDFQARFSQAMKVILDQNVQQGAVTPHQEQQALKRFGSTIPNWDRAGNQG